MTTFWKSPLVVLALSLTFYGFSSAAEGIYVQPAKYFDERSLTIMLDDLERQLAAVQVIDQSKLDAQLGVSSGTTRRAFGFSVNVGGPALPGIITKSTLNSAGVLAPSEQTVTQAAATPTAPTSPTVNALAGAPAPGINSEAMLSEQINLTYRLYSLRTLLNRSISDRLYVKDPKAVKNGEKFVTGTRKQVLLGFSIDVQPPKNSEEKEAYVRIDINPMGGRLPSVVSLMPQEKTFNVATVSEKANSFGFAIPISVITVGLSVGSQSQALFVYRDTDTVGRLDSPIRPVLGRKWVEPGNRKVFVTLSLDSEDNPSAVEELSYTVTTGWRKLKDRMAIDQAVESGPAEIGTVLIYGEKVVRGTLEPQISKAMISPLSATNALVTFEGKNFFPGTRLAIGDSLISESGPALTIPSDEALTFSAKLTDLESGFASVYGRYGLPVPVKADPKSNYKLGFRLSLLASPDPGRDLVPVQLGLRECADRQLQTSCTTPTWIRDENITLLVSAGSQQQLISGQTMYESCVELPDKSKPCFLTTDIEVTKDSLNKEQKISISVPFAGPAFRDTRGLQNPLSFNKLVKLGGALGGSEYWLLQGVGIKAYYLSGIKFTVGDQSFTLDCKALPCPTGVAVQQLGETAIQLTIPSKFFDSFKQVAVMYESAPPFLLPIPPLPKPESSVVAKNIEVSLSSSSTVEFAGTSLDVVKRVMYGNKLLPFLISKDGTKLTLFLNPTVTGTPGIKALAAMGEADTLFALSIDVRPTQNK